MSFQLPSNHYRLSSQSYGGFSFDSIGRANSQGASTVDDPTSAPLNGPPSAVFLPHGAGKTVGQNGRTLAFPGQYTFGQTRANDQKVQWVPARPTSLANGATGINSSLAYKAVAPTWDLTELFRQVRDVKLHRQWHCNSPLSTITRLALTSIRTHTYTYAHAPTGPSADWCLYVCMRTCCLCTHTYCMNIRTPTYIHPSAGPSADWCLYMCIHTICM